MVALTFMIKESFTIQTNKSEEVVESSICFKYCFCTKTYNFQEIKTDFETNLEDFECWYSKPINTLREFGYSLYFFQISYTNLA
jgi:hypothetical protein